MIKLVKDLYVVWNSRKHKIEFISDSKKQATKRADKLQEKVSEKEKKLYNKRYSCITLKDAITEIKHGRYEMVD